MLLPQTNPSRTVNMLKVKLLVPTAKMPTKANATDFGLDLYSAQDIVVQSSIVDPATCNIPVSFNHATLVSTGIACEFLPWFGAIIRDRSGMATKTGLFVVAGIIDCDYRGEIKIAFRNLGEPYQIYVGDKIAQMILTPVVDMPIIKVEELSKTIREASGFGESGR